MSINPSSSQNDSSGATGFSPLPDEQAAQKSAGQPLADVGKKTIAISKADLEKFEINEEYAKQNPALVDLILKTESMKDEERKYWFQLLPIMSEDQVQKLQGILQNEKDQLQELDKKYEAEVSKLNETHSNWDPKKFTAKRKTIEEAEKAHQENEKNDEEDILNQLENM
jgi:hypothetical protein